MAIEINTRTKILAGVVALAAAGAGAWFFLLQDEPPPTPPPAAKAPAKPAAEAPKGAPAAGAKAPADAAKAAAAPKGPPKPVPTDPAQVVAAIVEETGMNAAVHSIAKGIKQYNTIKDPAAAKELDAALDRIWEPKTILAAMSGALRTNYDANRMPRYLDLLRQPVVQKMVALELAAVPASPEAAKEQVAFGEKNPPAEERAKVIARLEQIFRPLSQVDGSLETAFIDGMLEQLHTDKRANEVLTKMGDGNARNARTAQLAKLNEGRAKRIKDALSTAIYTYRSASDGDLVEYVKLLDTEIGEWGIGALAGVLRPELQKRAGETGRIMGKLIIASLQASAKTPSQKPAAAEEKPAEKLAVATPKPPAAANEAPPYQRPANIREAYTRYNDLLTATVMRDRVAVKELLDAGKHPNVRQRDGKTALMIAAGNGDADLVQMLLAKGADPNLTAAGGITALSSAREARRADVVQLLERSGAKN